MKKRYTIGILLSLLLVSPVLSYWLPFSDFSSIFFEETAEEAIAASPCDFTVSVVATQHQTLCADNKLKQGGGELQATVYVNGAAVSSANYNFEWYLSEDYGNRLGVGDNIASLKAGNYTVQVTLNDKANKYNCQPVTASITVEDHTPEPYIRVVSLPEFNGCDEAATVDVKVVGEDGNLSPFQITWYDEAGNRLYQNKNSVSDVGPGIYTLVGLDTETGCTTERILEVTGFFATPEIEASVQASSDCYSGNGSAQLTITTPYPGTPPPDGYIVNWYDGSRNLLSNVSGTDVSGLPSGQYIVEIIHRFKDSSGNTLGDCGTEFTFEVPDAIAYPEAVLSGTNNTVCAEGNGVTFTGTVTAAITVDGQTVSDYTGYTFEWRKGSDYASASVQSQTGANLSAVDGGTYWLSVISPQGCSSQQPVSFTVQDVLPTYSLTLTPTPQTNCQAPANGSVTASLLDANKQPISGATYTWYIGNDTSGASGATASGLSGNQTYTIIATDPATNCTTENAVTVALAEDIPQITTTTTPNTGCVAGKYTGTITINASATSSTNFEYSLDGGAWQSSNLFSGLNAGSYTVQARNADTGCLSATSSVEIINNIGALTLSLTPTAQTNCDPTAPNGQIVANMAGATGSITYEWFEGTSESGTRLSFSGNTATGLKGGSTYFLKATDTGSGCVRTNSTTVTVNTEKPVVTLTTTPNVGCVDGLYTGKVSASISFSDPAASFSYTWYEGNKADATKLLDGESSSEISGYKGGDYTVVVTNTTTLCTSLPVTATVTDTPPTYTLNLTETPQTNCEGTPNGSITADLAGISGATFEWFTGDNTSGTKLSETSSTASGLSGGQTYTVRATDPATGCTTIASTQVPLEQETPILTVAALQNNQACETSLYNGQIDVTLSYTGTGSFTYTWYKGSEVKAENVISGASSAQLSSLTGGTYTVVAKHASLGCTSEPLMVRIDDVPLDYQLLLTPTPQTNCAATSNGSINASLQDNGTALGNVSYSWYDETGTAITSNISGATASQLAGGKTYKVVAKDLDLGCTVTQTVYLPLEEADYQLSTTVTNNSICDPTLPSTGNYNGQITASIGTEDLTQFTFSWYKENTSTGTFELIPGVSTATLSNLAPGTYQVEAVHNTDECTAERIDVVVGQDLNYPLTDISFTPNQRCDTNYNGTATVSLQSGASFDANYTIEWFAGDFAAGTVIGTASTLSNLESGDYTARITNLLTGCKDVVSVFVTDDIKPLQATISATQAFECPPTSVANIQVDVLAGGTAVSDYTGYTFDWKRYDIDGNLVETFTTITSDNTLNGLQYSGKYVVNISNTLGCVAEASYKLSSPVADFTIGSEVITPPSTCMPNDGEVRVFALDAGGIEITSGHTFEWYKGNPEPEGADLRTDPPVTFGAYVGTGDQLSGLTYGTYTIVATRTADNCKTFQVIKVPFKDAHQAIVVDESHILTCPPGGADGVARAQVRDKDGNVKTDPENYVFRLYKGSNPDITTGSPDLLDTKTGSSSIPGGYHAEFFNLPTGTYSIIAEETGFCSSIASVFDIEHQAVAPAVSTPTISPNTICTPGFYNGSIGLTVGPGEFKPGETDPVTNAFSIIWKEGPTGFTLPANQTDVPAASYSFPDLAPGAYKIQLYGNTSDGSDGCSTFLNINVPDAPLKPVVTTSLTQALEICGTPAKLEVTDVSLDGSPQALTDFDYAWYLEAEDGTSTAVGSNAPTYETETVGRYYVIVTRKDDGAAGSSCSSVRRYIQVDDQRVDPTISFAVDANTVCDLTNYTADGEIRATVATKGTALYQWYEGTSSASGTILTAETSATLSQVAPGDYTLLVTDQTYSCTYERTVNVPDKPVYPAIVSVSATKQTGCTNNEGTLTVDAVRYKGTSYTSADPEFSNFEFAWTYLTDPTVSITDTDASIAGMAGNYEVVVTTISGEGLGCSSQPYSATITREVTYPSISFNMTPNSNCEGTGNGILEAIASTGSATSTYTYEWNSSGTSDPNILSALSAGAHFVTVIDQATGCSTTQSYMVTDKLSYPIITAATITKQLTQCGDHATLEVTSMKEGVLADYTFQWYDAGGAAFTDSTNTYFRPYNPGIYAVRAKHKTTGCPSPLFYINLPDQRTYTSATASITPLTSCDPINPNGDISLTINRAMAGSDVEAIWYDAAGTEVFRETVAAPANTSTYANIAAGDYTVELVEGYCSKEYTFSVPDENYYFPIILNIASTDQTSCDPNGTMSVTKIEIDGVIYDSEDGDDLNKFFDFVWYDENGQEILSVPADSYDATLATIDKLATGNYSVEAIRKPDAAGVIPIGNGCPSARVSGQVGRSGFFPVISFTTHPNTNCSGPGNGWLEATVTYSDGSTPGAGDIEYYWDGATTASTDNTKTGLKASDAITSLRVVDTNTGCEATKTVSVADAPVYPQITGLSIQDKTYCDTDNGNLTVTSLSLNGVNEPDLSQYAFNWYKADGTYLNSGVSTSGLTEGDYYVIATKASGTSVGCESPRFPASIRFSPNRPQVTISGVPNTNCESPNGTLTPSVSMGSGDFAYTWTLPTGTATNTVNLSNLTGGTYILRVDDNVTGCYIETQYVLKDEKHYPEIASDALTHITTCGGTGSIAITAMASGDLSDYQISWHTTSADAYAGLNPILTAASMTAGPGTYFVRIEGNNPALDGFGCYTVKQYQILDQTPELKVFLNDSRMINGCNSAGMLSIMADDFQDSNNPDYVFQWTDAQGNAVNSNILNNQPIGDYTYTVTRQSTGCSVTGTYSIVEKIVNPVLSATAEAQWLCNPEDGRLFVRVANYDDLVAAIGPVQFQFEWYHGEHTTNPGSTSPDFIAARQNDFSMLLEGQPAGKYSVFASQIGGNGCLALPDTALVLDLREYPKPAIELDAPLSNCDPARPNAVLQASVDGVTEGFEFEWYEGTDLSAAPILSGSATLTEARAIRYTVLVRDQYSGCADTVSYLVPEEYQEVELDPYWVQQEPSLSCMQPDGKFYLTDASLSDQYIFRWYAGSEALADSLLAEDATSIEGLAAGSYTLTAQSRATGCFSDALPLVLESDYYVPAFDLKVTPSTCTDPGFVEIIDLDGQLREYYWSDGKNVLGNDPTFTAPAGKYWVTIVSLEGCSTTFPFTIEDDLKPYNAISANGDGENDYFHINCVEMYPHNNIKIYNRAGVLVFEVSGYDNVEKVFTGIGNRGLYFTNQNLPDGTYFYVLDRKDGSVPETGFLELIR